MLHHTFIMVLSMAWLHQTCSANTLPQNTSTAEPFVFNTTDKLLSLSDKIHSKRDLRKENVEYLKTRFNYLTDVRNFSSNSSLDNIFPNLTFAQIINDQAYLPFMGKKEFHLGGPVALPTHSCPNFCHAGHQGIGTCAMPEDCYRSGGTILGPCCGDFLVCCQVTQQCGGTSSDALVNFQSPRYPSTVKGTIACDFELNIREDVCAVRIDYVHVHLYGKFGGVCDVDQIIILNSVDGPISSQCGDLSGYATTVAVRPGQEMPLKLVIIAQNEGYYSWDIRLRQIQCNKLNNFRRPPVCGKKEEHDTSVSFYQLLDLWRNAAWYQNHYMDRVWWRQPGPSFNRFYYEASMRAMKNVRRDDVAEDRIIGGTEAELHEFPWQVAIILKRVFFCGGALINEEFVISAAHCFITQDTPVADLVVFLGDHDLTSSNDTISDVRGVRRVHFHSHFHAILLSNDIALLQLDRPVSFSQRVRPICLPDLGEQSLVGANGVVAGWGITSYPDGKPNAILQKLDVQVISNDECETALNENLGAGNLCAVPQSKQGTCFGDSGGPLTVTYQNKDVLVGIVSFGITGCAVAPGNPDLYTRISEYIKWIEISTIKYFE